MSAATVCAVVVTHDRRELLLECLAAVEGQSHAVDHVLVIDNASADGTPEAVAEAHPGAELVRLPRNEGGAGGFHEGLRLGARGGWGWLWLMDDDTIPERDALERLLAAAELAAGDGPPALLASRVVWTDGRIHPMNPPRLDMSDADAVVRGFERGAVPMRLCTFPSLLVRGDVPRTHPLPQKRFFVWSDDIDFTARVLRHGERGYFVPGSVAVHKTAAASAPWAGGERFYYAVRNGLWLAFGDALNPPERIFQLALVAGQVRRFLAHERYSLRALRTVIRGVFDALRAPRRAR